MYENTWQRFSPYYPSRSKPKRKNKNKKLLSSSNQSIRDEAMSRLENEEREELGLTAKKKDAIDERVAQIERLYNVLDDAKTTWLYSKMSPTIVLEKAKKLIQKGYNDPDYKTAILDNVVLLKNIAIADESKKYDYANIQGYNIYSFERLYNAREVWHDFLKGKLPTGFDMLTWILLSLILDIVAFMFSLIAFRSKQSQ